MDSKRPVIPESIRTVITDDGATLLDVRCGMIYALNPTGGHIWNQLTLGRTKEEIATELSNEFNIPQARLLFDLDQFFSQLAAKGLVTL
jgi:hypothetical protein